MVCSAFHTRQGKGWKYFILFSISCSFGVFLGFATGCFAVIVVSVDKVCGSVPSDVIQLVHIAL